MTKVYGYNMTCTAIGKLLCESGAVHDFYAPQFTLKRYMTAPVTTVSVNFTLHFQSYEPYCLAVNWRATRLFGRPGFYIYGPALLIEKTEKWHCLRVARSKASILAKLSHLTFKGGFGVHPTSKAHTRHYVVTRDLSDVTMMKMVL